MNLKSRVERLEEVLGSADERVEIDFGDGRFIQLERGRLREILAEIAGADTGPGPASSRRAP